SFSTGHAIGKWFYWIWCYNILLSVVIGIVVGYVARKLLRWAESYDLIDKESFLAFSIGLAVFIVGILQLIRSDDVLCCFIAGHAFTWDDWFREETKDAHFQEVLDGLINVTFFIYFGTIIPWHQFNNAELVIAPWRLIVAAIMVLLLRRLPIVVLLTRLTPAFRNYRQSMFAGWFGPIGVGAIFFAEIVLEEIEHEPEHFHLRSREIIVPIVSFLIFSSVVVHGITLPLVYIGKVVRTRSRSISSMSIRNGIASRLSFVNSREPTGIHGVHIPMIHSHSGSPDDEYVDDVKHDARPMFSTSTDASPTAHGDESPKDDTYGPAGPLDLTRTITIDETPKTNRNQMDVHLQLMNSRAKYTEHAQNQHTPTALSGPMYSHLLHNATDRMHQNQQPHPPPPQRSQSAREISGSAESADDKDLAAAKAAAVAACAGDKSEPNIRIADEQLAQEEAKAEAAAQRHEDTSRQQQQQEEDGDGLMLAADHIIASRATTQNTIMSVPEVYQPQRRSHDLPPLQPVVSRHPSLPETNYSPSVAAAHHRGGNVLRQRRRQSARRSSVSGI
ncbi:Na+/H+ antiporter, partial [Coemansia sp. RSA 2603]